MTFTRTAPGRKPLVALTIVLGALALSACGSSDEGSETGAAKAAATTAATAATGDGELAAKLAALKAAPRFEHPGPAIDVSSLQGKTFWVIPFASTAEFNKIQADATVQAGKAAGVNVKVYTTSGVPSQWQQAMDRALADKPAGISLQGVPPQAIAPQIRQAKAAGIPVTVSHGIDITEEEQLEQQAPGVEIAARAPFTEATRRVADYVIEESGGKAKVLYISQDDMAPVMPGMVKAFEDEMQAKCPDCTVYQASTTFADAATKAPTAVQAALREHPDIDWIVPSFDNLVPLVVSALRTVGAQDEVKVAAYNGTAGSLKLIDEDGPVVMDIGESIPMMGYTTMDQLLRLALKEPPVDQPTFMRLFDASNVAEAGTPPTPTGGYGDEQEFVDGFKQLWGQG